MLLRLGVDTLPTPKIYGLALAVGGSAPNPLSPSGGLEQVGELLQLDPGGTYCN